MRYNIHSAEELSYEQWKEAWDDLDEDDHIAIWNEYCDKNNDPDGRIMSHSEFEEYIENMSPIDAFWAGKYSSVNPSSNYYQLDGYANLVGYECADTFIETIDIYNNHPELIEEHCDVDDYFDEEDNEEETEDE